MLGGLDRPPMKFSKTFKICLVVIGILILLPILYFAFINWAWSGFNITYSDEKGERVTQKAIEEENIELCNKLPEYYYDDMPKESCRSEFSDAMIKRGLLENNIDICEKIPEDKSSYVGWTDSKREECRSTILADEKFVSQCYLQTDNDEDLDGYLSVGGPSYCIGTFVYNRSENNVARGIKICQENEKFAAKLPPREIPAWPGSINLQEEANISCYSSLARMALDVKICEYLEKPLHRSLCRTGVTEKPPTKAECALFSEVPETQIPDHWCK